MSVVARTTNEAELSSQRRSLQQATTWDTTGKALSGIALLVGMLVVLYSLIPAIQWYNTPFPGIVTSYSLVVTGTRALTTESWMGLDAGLKPNDRLAKLTYDGPDGKVDVKLDGNADLYNQTLAQLRFGQQVTIQVLRPEVAKLPRPECPAYASGGIVCNYTFRLDRVPLGDFLIQYGLGFVTGMAILIIGAVMWLFRRSDEAARLIAAMCAAAAFVIVGRFDTITLYQNQAAVYWAFGACLLGALLVALGLMFPLPLAVVRRRPSLLALPFLIAALLFGTALVIYRQADPATYDTAQLIGSTGLAVGLLVLIGAMSWRRNRSVSSVVREQAGLALIGAVVAIIPLALWLATVALERWANVQNISFSSAFVMPSVVLFPLSLAYATLAYRRVDSDRIISESLIYGALGLVLVIGYLLVTSAVYVLSNSIIRFDNPLLIAITLFVIAVLFSPARLRLEAIIDRAFFRQRRIYEGQLESFSRQMALSVDLPEVVQKLKSQLDETIMPQYMFVFLRNSRSGDYEAFADPGMGKARTDIRFEATSPLVRMLDSGDPILYLESGQALPAELFSERSRLAVLNVPVIVRLRSRSRLNGFLALGPRKNSARYRSEEFRYLETLSGQAAAAFERAQIILDVQRNESELTVLSQVSAALSIAMDFDTLLEFVYAQVDKLVQAPNFYIALHDERNNELYYVFYQEEGDRISAKEGYRWAVGRDLMSEVFRTKQPIRTDNYVQETQRRDRHLPIDNPDLRSWMGVPLNAGEGTILGAMAAASTDPDIHYTEDQVRIFWAIAGLAATALFKTRLFSQTEERARQMKVLNDISSRLAKEFENIEALLKIITESAVEMLQAEAGSLLLRDETNGDLIFQLAIGGSGDDLVGSRIPAGSGIAGTVVATGRHVIVNDTQQDKRWYGEVGPNMAERNRDRNRKFSTRSILAVPLISRGGVIGVIEIINKGNGTGFFDEDAELLTTFAGQAAIAIQNARMFRMTDEALNLRVQQLDNMQRIDQELNRTLDLQRVVDLTIDNSMRESGADVGALALVRHEPPCFEIAGSIGYPEGILSPGDTHPLDLGILGKVCRTLRPEMIVASEIQGNPDYVEMLPGAKGQLAVPLVTGDEVSAVLILESLSGDAFNEVTATFIQGLAEHANTAITNAQLFQRLEIANQSRSQLMGFAAHELKNPMASIKGYSEILLGGMTGKLTEQQQGFIAVIRNNVVRMQQIVDDLRDLTAHETGNLKLNLAPTSFNNVVIETLRPQQRAIDEKEQKVVMNVPENLPPIWGDELRLIQVMTNFVSNANKYTPPGGTITIAAEVTPNTDDPNGPELLHCTITDTGIGMDDKDLGKLFTAYWRSDNPRAREQSGTGLGMTLTRGLIEAHGGKVWVESQLNVGTTFHITIPLVSEHQVVQKVGAHR